MSIKALTNLTESIEKRSDGQPGPNTTYTSPKDEGERWQWIAGTFTHSRPLDGSIVVIIVLRPPTAIATVDVRFRGCRPEFPHPLWARWMGSWDLAR